jgi:K+-sensing histidine kinase KdpD
MISHELRQPLTSIGGLVDMLMEHKEATESERSAIMEMIADSVKKLDESIRLLVKKLTRQI